MKSFREYISESEQWIDNPAAGDNFAFELSDGTLVETYILESTEHGILLAATDTIITVLDEWQQLVDPLEDLNEDVTLETMGYGGSMGEDDMDEAKYHGREVPLGKPMAGDVKKSKVYVKDPSTGNIKKVNFGDPNMRIKKSIPGRRKSFRARHHCENPGPRTKARYWSCRAW